MFAYALNMNILKRHIDQYKLTPKQVADMSGVSVRTVYAHLSGGRKIGHQAAVKYSQGLGLSLEKLLMNNGKD